MSKLHFSLIMLLLLTLVILKNIEYVYLKNYPTIFLPEKAHNTIGELPIIEHLDDRQVITPNKTRYSTITGDSVVYHSAVSCDMSYYPDQGRSYGNSYGLD